MRRRNAYDHGPLLRVLPSEMDCALRSAERERVSALSRVRFDPDGRPNHWEGAIFGSATGRPSGWNGNYHVHEQSAYFAGRCGYFRVGDQTDEP